MPALDPNEVVADASCFSCHGASTVEALELGLLDRWANAALNSFIERAGLTDPTQIAAVTALYESAIEHGWWAKCDLIYPFVGGNATAHAQNLKSDQFTITWHGTVTHNANGITGDAASGYGDTGYNASTSGQISVNSSHLSVYRRNTGSLNRALCGIDTAAQDLRLFKTIAGDAVAVLMSDNTISNISPSGLQLIMGVRFDSTNKHGFSISGDQSFSVASIAVPNFTIFILANNSSGVAASFSNVNLAGLTVGSGLTFSEYQLMAADWQTFQTSLGRQV